MIVDLQDALDIDSSPARQDAENDEQGRRIAELLTAYASQLGEDEAAALAGAYRIALDDVPAWALREAVRGWLRGEVGGSAARRSFPPPAPILRDYALSRIAVTKGRIVALRRLLDARERPRALTHEERAQAHERFSRLIDDLNSQPVPDEDETGRTQ